MFTTSPGTPHGTEAEQSQSTVRLGPHFAEMRSPLRAQFAIPSSALSKGRTETPDHPNTMAPLSGTSHIPSSLTPSWPQAVHDEPHGLLVRRADLHPLLLDRLEPAPGAQGSAKNPSLASPSRARARDRSGWTRVLMLGIRALKKTREACL